MPMRNAGTAPPVAPTPAEAYAWPSRRAERRARSTISRPTSRPETSSAANPGTEPIVRICENALFSLSHGQPKLAPQQFDLDHIQLDSGLQLLDQARRLSPIVPFVRDLRHFLKRAGYRFVLVFVTSNQAPAIRLNALRQLGVSVFFHHLRSLPAALRWKSSTLDSTSLLAAGSPALLQRCG